MDYKHVINAWLSGWFGGRAKSRLYYAGGLEDKIFKLECQLEENQKKHKKYIDEALEEIKKIQNKIHRNEASEDEMRDFVAKVNKFEELKKDLDFQLVRATNIINEEIKETREKLQNVEFTSRVVNDLKDNKMLYDTMN